MPNFRPDRLIAARRLMGISQDELAKRAGVNRNTIIAAENGHRTPHGGTLRALATQLGITVESLFENGHGQ